MQKRLYSRRHIQILALQRCSRAISMALREGLFLPDGFPVQNADYPYNIELDLACSEIGYQLRVRLAALAEREFNPPMPEIFLESDNLRL